MSEIKIGHLLRSGTTGFVVGCRVNQLASPAFGALTRVPIGDGTQVYGLIYDMHIDDDGLVRQLVTTDGVPAEVIADNRENRNVPVEIGVLAVGYQEQDKIYHLLPPRPPLSLDTIYLCSDAEICRFTSSGRFGYFRHILRDPQLSVAELLAAHLKQAQQAHRTCGDAHWFGAATQELITLLRDDYNTLIAVLGAISEVYN